MAKLYLNDNLVSTFTSVESCKDFLKGHEFIDGTKIIITTDAVNYQLIAECLLNGKPLDSVSYRARTTVKLNTRRK